MPVISNQTPNEGSTARFTLTLLDDAGNLLTPNSDLTWTLTDTFGNVMNGRSSVALAAAETVVIMLTGDDLLIGDAVPRRVLTLRCTYDNDAGSNWKFADEVHFTINHLATAT